MSNPRVFVKGQEITVEEGQNVEFTVSGDASGGFQVCLTKEEQRPASSLVLHSMEKRSVYDRTYYNCNGYEIARVTGVGEWEPVLDRTALPLDYKSKR